MHPVGYSLVEEVHAFILTHTVRPGLRVSWVSTSVDCVVGNEAVCSAHCDIKQEVELQTKQKRTMFYMIASRYRAMRSILVVYLNIEGSQKWIVVDLPRVATVTVPRCSEIVVPSPAGVLVDEGVGHVQ